MDGHFKTVSVFAWFCMLIGSTPGLVKAGDGPALESRLPGTSWAWHGTDANVKVDGEAAASDDAWLEVRFGNGGQFSAWNKSRVVFAGHWEAIGPKTVRITPHEPLGLILNFRAGFGQITVGNESTPSGTLLGQGTGPQALAGKWRWRGGDIVTLREDGQALSVDGNGKWKALDNGTFEINWRHGAFVDTVQLEPGSQRLKIKNQHGEEFKAKRVAAP